VEAVRCVDGDWIGPEARVPVLSGVLGRRGAGLERSRLEVFFSPGFRFGRHPGSGVEVA
jgi:hypothetical protein